MTYNKCAQGGLYKQMGGNTASFEERRRGGAKVIAFLMVLMILGAAGAGIWFLQ